MVGLAASKLSNRSRGSQLPYSDAGLIHMEGLLQRRWRSAVWYVELRIVPH